MLHGLGAFISFSLIVLFIINILRAFWTVGSDVCKCITKPCGTSPYAEVFTPEVKTTYSTVTVQGSDSKDFREGEEYVLPDHYRVLANALKPVYREIGMKLDEKPEPSGRPVKADVILPALCSEIAGTVDRLAREMSSIPGCIGVENEIVTEDAVLASAEALRVECRRLLKVYHKIWESRFPAPWQKGQQQVSECVEDVLKTCEETFGKLIDMVELKPDEIVKKYGGGKIHISMNLGSAPYKRLAKWTREMKLISV